MTVWGNKARNKEAAKQEQYCGWCGVFVSFSSLSKLCRAFYENTFSVQKQPNKRWLKQNHDKWFWVIAFGSSVMFNLIRLLCLIMVICDQEKCQRKSWSKLNESRVGLYQLLLLIWVCLGVETCLRFYKLPLQTSKHKSSLQLLIKVHTSETVNKLGCDNVKSVHL